MSTPAVPPEIGLCAACSHARTIENRRGSRFYLCEQSRKDPTFPRYPRLPMLRCEGYEPTSGAAGRPGDEDESAA